MAFVPETFILYPEKLNFASDKAAYTYMKRYIFSLYIQNKTILSFIKYIQSNHKHYYTFYCSYQDRFYSR